MVNVNIVDATIVNLDYLAIIFRFTILFKDSDVV